MTRFCMALLILCTLEVLAMPADAATSRMPYGSYLTRPVNDAHDFARLLRQDRVVAQRFADHFGMSNDAIADYIEEHGRVRTLSQAGSYVEFFIDKRGKAHRHFKRLRPKHRVLFVNGTPVLDLECGNPMTKSLPAIPRPQVTQAPPPVVRQPRPVAPPPPPPVEQPAPPAPPEVEITEQPPAPIAPPTPEVEVLPGPQVEYPAPAEAPPPSRRPNFLLPILIGAGIVALDDDGNPPPEPPPPPPPGPVIPEASTMVLGLGGAGFIVTWYRMRRR